MENDPTEGMAVQDKSAPPSWRRKETGEALAIYEKARRVPEGGTKGCTPSERI